MVIAGWLLSTRAQNIPLKCTSQSKRIIILSIFTLEHSLCLLLSLIHPAVYLLNKDLCELCVMSYTAPEFCPKCDIFFLKKGWKAFFYVKEYMLNLVILDKMQNISTLMRKSSKSEGRAF